MRRSQHWAWLLCATLFLLAMDSSSVLAQPRKTLTTAQIVKAALPSVVTLTVKDKNGTATKFGSGFVVGHNLIATNRHVLEDAYSVTANFPDGQSVPVFGQFQDLNDSLDLCLVVAKTGSRKPLQLADSSDIALGSVVVAIGSPEGLTGSVSTGIVSGIRHIGTVKAIQTSAPISHGSSGGPLLNERAEVLGVTSFGSSTGQNLNFAYPSYYLKVTLKKSQASLRESIDNFYTPFDNYHELSIHQNTPDVFRKTSLSLEDRNRIWFSVTESLNPTQVDERDEDIRQKQTKERMTANASLEILLKDKMLSNLNTSRLRSDISTDAFRGQDVGNLPIEVTLEYLDSGRVSYWIVATYYPTISALINSAASWVDFINGEVDQSSLVAELASKSAVLFNRFEAAAILGKSSQSPSTTETQIVRKRMTARVAVIIVKQAAMRADRKDSARILSTQPKGTNLALVYEMPGWYGVLMSDESVGWIKKNFVKLLDFQVDVDVRQPGR